MADKTFPLSIVIRTVDQATAGLKKINHQLETLTKPTRDFGAQLSKLGETSGFNKVADGFKEVGHALKEVAIIGLEVIAVAGEIVHLLIEKFANLGRTAKLIGVTATELAELRFAATQSGVSVEEFDSSMEKLNKSLGEMKAGGGKLKSFLQTVSPPLLKQIQAAKSNVEALDLLANAMKKLKDPTKRAALATAAFGRGGQPLINMLAQGAENIDELMKEYYKLAGSQDAAAESAHELHQAQGRISAVFDGIEASILVAVAPALEKLAKQFTSFLVEHREEIAAFIKDFGEKLPARIEAVVNVFKDVLAVITPVWNAIGGLHGAVVILGAYLSRGLVLAIAQLSLALLTTPFGWVLLSIAAVAAAIVLLIKNFDKLKAAWEFLNDENIINPVEVGKGFERVGRGVALPTLPALGPRLGEARPVGGGTPAGTEARIKVDFANAPKGTRVTTDPKSTADVDLAVGYQMSYQ